MSCRGFDAVCSTSEARAYFAQKNLTYGSIEEGDILVLIMMLQKELKASNKNAETSVHMTLSTRVRMKKKTNGKITSCFLFMNSHYFTQREAISFNENGFIGFAGWADQGNTNPLLRAFLKWCDYMAEQEEEQIKPLGNALPRYAEGGIVDGASIVEGDCTDYAISNERIQQISKQIAKIAAGGFKFSNRMTEERKGELRELCEKATPGPWEFDTDGGHTVGVFENFMGVTIDEEIYWNRKCDMELAAESRSAMPELLAEIDRLNEEINHRDAEYAALAKRFGEED